MGGGGKVNDWSEMRSENKVRVAAMSAKSTQSMAIVDLYWHPDGMYKYMTQAKKKIRKKNFRTDNVMTENLEHTYPFTFFVRLRMSFSYTCCLGRQIYLSFNKSIGVRSVSDSCKNRNEDDTLDPTSF